MTPLGSHFINCEQWINCVYGVVSAVIFYINYVTSAVCLCPLQGFDKVGYLKKRDPHNVGGWRRRWFTLKGKSLAYYKVRVVTAEISQLLLQTRKDLFLTTSLDNKLILPTFQLVLGEVVKKERTCVSEYELYKRALSLPNWNQPWIVNAYYASWEVIWDASNLLSRVLVLVKLG